MMWSTLVRTRVEPWVFVELDSAQALPELPRREVVPNEYYLHVRLHTMRLLFGRRWFATYHASLNSHARLEHGTGQPAEFLLTTSPAQLRSIGSGDRRRVALGPTRLAGPVPYCGGGLDLDIGLFAIKNRDLTVPYLDFLQDLGAAIGVSFIGHSIGMIRPLQQALTSLLGLADTLLEAGAARTFDPVRTGVFAVLATTQNQLGDRRCRLIDDTLCWMNGQPVEDAAHIVFSVQTSKHRADWRSVPGLSDVYEDLITAARDDSYPDIDERLARFRRTVLLSPDLTQDDANTITTTVTNMVHAALGTSGQTTIVRNFPSLGELNPFPQASDESANHDLKSTQPTAGTT